MNTTTCRQCGKAVSGRKYCNTQCKTDWHNKNRVLTPNLKFNCKVCGKHVEKWVAPSRLKNGADTGEYCSRTCAGVGRSGSNHFNWQGGRRVDRDGYILVYCPDHPHAGANGCVREHRLKMESKIGRYLLPSEVVHHKDDNPANNRITNLELYSDNKRHKKDDYKKRKIDRRGRLLPKRKGK